MMSKKQGSKIYLTIEPTPLRICNIKITKLSKFLDPRIFYVHNF